MPSLRTICSSLGIDRDDISVNRHFFGFRQSRVPAALVGAPTSVSVLQQIDAVEGNHFHLNVIRVGSDNFTNSDIDEIDEAIHLTRTVYEKVNLGIGRIEHYIITEAEADGLDVLTSNADADQLTADWTVPNDGQDLFIVLNWTGNTLGRSNIEGPCDKNDDSDGQTGSITAMTSSRQETGHTTAHELGHYLGLTHRNQDATNVMAQTSAVGNLNGTIDTATIIDSGQASEISDHCSVKGGI